MAGREVREYTNLSDPKDKKFGKGKDKIDDEDITFQRMVAKVNGFWSESCGKLCMVGIEHFCECRDPGSFYWVVDASRCKKLLENVEATFMGEAIGAALDSDDLLYLKEQMEAEEDAERLLRRTEKRAFAAFKKAASLVDSSPASLPLPLRVEPKPKSGIRQQDLLRKVVEIKPKRQRQSELSSPASASGGSLKEKDPEVEQEKGRESKMEKPVKSILGLAYASSDEEDETES